MDIDPPVGDPGEMRRKAQTLGVECDSLIGMARGLDQLLEVMDYQCRSAEHLRDAIRRDRLTLEGIVDDLRAVQGRILREAGRVEDAQAACARIARAASQVAL